jgi:hypothetical protein
VERLQRNAGTAGYVSALLLLVVFILSFAIPGTGSTFTDPARTLTFVVQNRWLWRLNGVAGVLVAGFAVLFAVGVWSRLREPAPTRGTVSLYLATIGLGGYALSSFILWKGGSAVASYMSRDPVAATHAWLALHYAARGAIDVGNAFVGAALILAGWAIAETAALTRSVGRLGVIAGVLSLAVIVSLPFVRLLELLQTVLTIVWLAWVGSELRKG